MVILKNSIVVYVWINRLSIIIFVVFDVVIKFGQLKEGKVRVVFVVSDGSGSCFKEIFWDFVFVGNFMDYFFDVFMLKDGVSFKQIIDGFFFVFFYVEVRGSGVKDFYVFVIFFDGSFKRLFVEGGEIFDVFYISDLIVKEGVFIIGFYGKVKGEEKFLVKRSVYVIFVSVEVFGDEIDNDMDGFVDCDDLDIVICDVCIMQKKFEWVELLMERYIDYINKMIEIDLGMKSVYDFYIEYFCEFYDWYKDDFDRMVKEMNVYMEEKVYRNQEIKGYIFIFVDDFEKCYQFRQIVEKYWYDLIMRRIKMRSFIYENFKSEVEREVMMNVIFIGIFELFKWFVGGQYGFGGVFDWVNFVVSNFEIVGDIVKLKGILIVKMFRMFVNIFIVVQDVRVLMKQVEEFKKMNLFESMKVFIIVFDGVIKIGKFFDLMGYFGNMVDVIIGVVVNFCKKIEERNQGWFMWNGYVFYEMVKFGIYEDYEMGKKFKWIFGGWFSFLIFVEVKENE